MNSEQILPIIMGFLAVLHIIPVIIYWIYIPKLGKCTPNIALRSVAPLINILIGFCLLIYGGVSRQLVLTIALLAINLGVGLFFEYRSIIRAEQRHTWNGCKCTKCGVIDPNKHKIGKKTCECKTCGQVFHDLDGCQCKICGVTIHKRSIGICRCERCGQENHHFVQAKCTYCGATSPNHQHTFRLFHGIGNFRKETDVYKCAVCGELAVGFALDNQTKPRD